MSITTPDHSPPRRKQPELIAPESALVTVEARPSRRGMLGALAAFAASPIVFAPFQIGAADAKIATASDPRDAELIALGKSIEALETERDQARAECLAARSRFEAIAPAQPEEMRLIFEEDPWRHEFYPHHELRFEGSPIAEYGLGAVHRLVIDADRLKAQLSAHPARTADGKSFRRTLKIAEKYRADLDTAAQESGYRAASARLDPLDRQITKVAMKAFEIEAVTHAGLAAQARAMLAIAAQGNDGYWAKHVYSPVIARALIKLSAGA
jgi:hypothetical protein